MTLEIASPRWDKIRYRDFRRTRVRGAQVLLEGAPEDLVSTSQSIEPDG